MSIPVRSDLLGMEYAFQSQPFVEVAGNATPVLETMDYSFQSQPFVRNPFGGAVTTKIKSVCGVLYASIKKASGVALANIKKISGVDNF